jgi:hypothetical protein
VSANLQLSCLQTRNNTNWAAAATASSKSAASRKAAPVGGALGRVDQLISQALGNGLDVPEGRLARARGDQPDGLPTWQCRAIGVNKDFAGVQALNA